MAENLIVPDPRISGRLGHQIDLNITFFRDGIPTDPYAIRKVSIYKSAVQPENLIAEFPVVPPTDPLYPSPLSREEEEDEHHHHHENECHSSSSGSVHIKPGIYHLYWDVPASGIPVPDTFFDVWSYIPDNPCPAGSSGSSGSEPCDLDNQSLWVECCNQFWLYPDNFYCDDELTNIRLGFEALDMKFNQPETRTIEVGIMPLPLYDYDYNKIAPIIPRLKGYFSLMTDNCELLIDRAPMRIGVRQGTYRSNPFVLQYRFDTRLVLKGSYQYQVVICLPNGETRASSNFHLQVS